MRDKSGLLRWPRDIIAILSALSALLIYSQYTTLLKFAVLRPAHRYASLAIFIPVLKRHVQLEMADAIVVSLIFAALVTIIVLELWKKRLSTFLSKVFETEKRTLFVLVLACLFCARFYFARGGLAWAGDANFHIGYAWIASQSFSQGEIPIWTNYFGTGGPYCQFYGFLFFYLTGVVNLLFSDLEFSLKFVMGVSHVFSGIGMYLFVRTLFNRQAGFMAALAYVMVVWHTQQVLIMGRFPLSVFYALLPFPFYFFERLRVRTPRLACAMGGGLTLGMLAFTHPGYAFWATALLGLYVCIRLWSDTDRRGIRAVCWHSLLLLMGGLAFGAYLTLPMWMERENAGLKFGVNLSGLPDPTWSQLLIWSNYRFRLFFIEANHWYGGYLGLSLIALSLVGLTSSLLFWRRLTPPHRHASTERTGTKVTLAADLPAKSWPATACLIVSLLLVFGYRWPLLGSLSVVQAFNAGRYLLFVVFFLSVTVGVGTVALVRFCRSRGTGIDIFAILLLIVVVDLGPTTFQQPYIRYSALKRPQLIDTKTTQFLRSEAAQFPNGEIPNYRSFYATDTDYRPFSISYLSIKTGLVTFLGLFNEAPMATNIFCHPLEKSLNPAIRKAEKLESPVSQKFGPLRDGLYLLNTKRFLARHSRKKNTLMNWTIPDVSPVVISSKVAGWDLPARNHVDTQAQLAFLQLVKAMGVNQAANTCDQILLTGHTSSEDLGTSPSVKVLEHRAWNQRVEMLIRTSSPCFARLAYAYYPYLSVTVNDKKVVPYQTAGRFIALRLGEGEQHIVLEPVLSPLRRGLLILNLAMVGACLAYFGWRVRHSWPMRYFLKNKGKNHES